MRSNISSAQARLRNGHRALPPLRRATQGDRKHRAARAHRADPRAPRSLRGAERCTLLAARPAADDAAALIAGAREAAAHTSRHRPDAVATGRSFPSRLRSVNFRGIEPQYSLRRRCAPTRHTPSAASALSAPAPPLGCPRRKAASKPLPPMYPFDCEVASASRFSREGDEVQEPQGGEQGDPRAVVR